MPMPFGTPAAAAWTAIVVLIGVFAMINYGIGLVLDGVMHSAPGEISAPLEPASVMVDLPPPLTPKLMPAATQKPVAAAVPRRSGNWDSRRHSHGWGSRRWRQPATKQDQTPPLGGMVDPHPSASQARAAPLVQIEGLAERIIDGAAAPAATTP